MTPGAFADRRRALGLSQFRLAGAMGICTNTVAAWEQAINPIPAWTWRMIELLEYKRSAEIAAKCLP